MSTSPRPAGNLTNDQQILDILFAVLCSAEAEIYLPDSQCNGIARRYLEGLCRNSWDELPTSLKAWIEHFCRENFTHSAGLKQAFAARADQSETEQQYLARLFDATRVERQALGDVLFNKTVHMNNTSLTDQLRVCLFLGLSGNVKRLYLKAEKIIHAIDAENKKSERLLRQADYWYAEAARCKKNGFQHLARLHAINAEKLSTQSRSSKHVNKSARQFAKEFILHRIEHDHFMPPKEHERLLRFLNRVLRVPKSELPKAWSSRDREVMCYSNETQWRDLVTKRMHAYWFDATPSERTEQEALVRNKRPARVDIPYPIESYSSFPYQNSSQSKLDPAIMFDVGQRWRVQLQIEESRDDGRIMAMPTMPGTRDVKVGQCQNEAAFWRELTRIHQAVATGQKNYRHTHVPFDLVDAVEQFQSKYPEQFADPQRYARPEFLADVVINRFFADNFSHEQKKIRNSSQERVLVETALQSIGLLEIKRGELGQARRGLLAARHIYSEPDKRLTFDLHFSAQLLKTLTGKMIKPKHVSDRRRVRFDYNVGALKKIIKALSSDRLLHEARKSDVNYLGIKTDAGLVTMVERLKTFGLKTESLCTLLSYASSADLQKLLDTEGFSQKHPVVWTEAFLVLCDKHPSRIEACQVIEQSAHKVTDPNPATAFQQVADLPVEARGKVQVRIENYFHEYASALHDFKKLLETRSDHDHRASRKMLKQLGNHFLPLEIRKNLVSYIRKLMKDGCTSTKSERLIKAAIRLLDEVETLKRCDLFKAIFYRQHEHVLEQVWTPEELQAAFSRKASDKGRHALAVSRLKVEGHADPYVKNIAGYTSLFFYAFALVGKKKEAIRLAPCAYQLIQALDKTMSSAKKTTEVTANSTAKPNPNVLNRKLVIALGVLATKINSSCGWTLFWYRFFGAGSIENVYQVFVGTIRAHGDRAVRSRARSIGSSGQSSESESSLSASSLTGEGQITPKISDLRAALLAAKRSKSYTRLVSEKGSDVVISGSGSVRM